MHFDTPLIEGILIRRHKRFLADVQLENDAIITAHTANTGAMTGCSDPGARVWLSDSGNQQRKYPLTWELVESLQKRLIGINTGLSNKLVKEAIQNGILKALQGYHTIRSEVCYGNEKSRIDLLLEDGDGPKCFIEVKNVTLLEGKTARFPDAVSTRGSKHLRELISMVQQGFRAVLFFCVQREDALAVSPADDIDPEYGQLLRLANSEGVEVMAYGAHITRESIELRYELPVIYP